MSQPKFILRSLAVAVALASNFAQAEETTDQSSITTDEIQLAPIVVTATKGKKANGLVVVADPKQPIQPVPATDGADYLKSIVGFNAISSGGTNGDVTFRGMFGSRIKMLTNGTEKLGACPARMDAPTSYISPETYDKITVVKGPETVLYPTPGSAATVLFEHTPPKKLTSEKPYQGTASVLVGSYGRLDQNFDGTLGDETKYLRLTTSRSTSNSYKDGNGNKVPSAWERWTADMAMGWTPDDDTWLELNAGTGDGYSEYAGRSMDGVQFKRQSLGFHAEKKNLTEHIKKIEAQIDYTDNDHVMDNYSYRVNTGTKSSMELARQTLNSRLAMTSEWGKLSVVSGVDSQHWNHGGDMKSTMMMMNKPYMRNMKYQSYGAFSELTYHLNDSNQLVTGVRLDRVAMTTSKTNIITNPSERIETVPSAFIRLENSLPDSGIKNYVGLGYVERVPDFWELFSTKLASGAYSINNMDAVKTEKTTQLDIGSQWQQGKWNAWASAYAGIVKDFILIQYANPSISQSYPTVRNVDATIAGAETGLGYQFTPHIQTDLSVMYAWGENTSDHTPLPQIAPLEARLNLRYVQDRYTLGLLVRSVAEQNRYSLNQGNIVGYDMGASKAFTTIALNATYHLTQGVDLSLGVDNLFNKAYAEHLNKAGASAFGYAANTQFDSIGRNYWARMSFKF